MVFNEKQNTLWFWDIHLTFHLTAIRAYSEPAIIPQLYSARGTKELYDVSPWASSTLKYITCLVILDTDDDPKDVGLPSIPGPDMPLKKQVNKTVSKAFLYRCVLILIGLNKRPVENEK